MRDRRATESERPVLSAEWVLAVRSIQLATRGTGQVCVLCLHNSLFIAINIIGIICWLHSHEFISSDFR